MADYIMDTPNNNQPQPVEEEGGAVLGMLVGLGIIVLIIIGASYLDGWLNYQWAKGYCNGSLAYDGGANYIVFNTQQWHCTNTALYTTTVVRQDCTVNGVPTNCSEITAGGYVVNIRSK